jgi:hypothetical protein
MLGEGSAASVIAEAPDRTVPPEFDPRLAGSRLLVGEIGNRVEAADSESGIVVDLKNRRGLSVPNEAGPNNAAKQHHIARGQVGNAGLERLFR